MNQIKVGAILSYLGILATMIVAIFYTPILVKQLGQAEYGVYTLIGAFVGYLTILDMGLGNAIVRYIARTRANNNTAEAAKLSGMFLILFSVIGVIVLIIGTVLYFQLDRLFGAQLNAEELKLAQQMTIILVINFAVSFPLSVFGAIINAHERFIFLKLTSVIRTFVTPMLIVPLLFLGHGSVMVVLITTLINILFLIFNVYYAFKKLQIRIKFEKFDKDLLKEITIYSGFIFLNAIIDKIYWSTDQVILGAVSGVNQVAIYAIAMQFIMIYMTISTAISGLFLPKVSIMEMNGEPSWKFSNLFLKVGRVQSFIMIPTLISFYIIGQSFIDLWVGNAYQEAYWIVLIIMIPLMIILCQNIGISILQAKNLHGFRSIVYFVIAIINIIISIPVAKIYGAIPLAIVTASCLICANLIIINIYYKLKIGIDIIVFWKSILAYAFMNANIAVMIKILISLYLSSYIYKDIVWLILYLFSTITITYNLFLKKADKEYIRSKISYFIR